MRTTKICMVVHWRMLLVLGFSDCSWVERDVDRGQSMIKRNVLELSNLPWEGYFRALYAPLGEGGILLIIEETLCLHVQR